MEKIKQYVQELYNGKITNAEFKEKYITLIIKQVIADQAKKLCKM
jgi:ribosomal protein L22